MPFNALGDVLILSRIKQFCEVRNHFLSHTSLGLS